MNWAPNNPFAFLLRRYHHSGKQKKQKTTCGALRGIWEEIYIYCIPSVSNGTHLLFNIPNKPVRCFSLPFIDEKMET